MNKDRLIVVGYGFIERVPGILLPDRGVVVSVPFVRSLRRCLGLRRYHAEPENRDANHQLFHVGCPFVLRSIIPGTGERAGRRGKRTLAIFNGMM